MEDRRYSSLRIVAVLLRVLAVIVLLLGGAFVILGGFGRFGAFDRLTPGLPGGADPGFTAATLVSLVGVALYALFLWAGGAMITLFIDLERNTRATADMIANMGRRPAPPPPPAPRPPPPTQRL